MKLLLTSSGISNPSIRAALEDLLEKPIAESTALFIPTGIYPFKQGQNYAWNPIAGDAASRMCGLGWKSMGILELSVLPSIAESQWIPSLEEADALLVWGGDPVFIQYWMEKSGVADILESVNKDLVYVGVSAGSMIVSKLFAEVYDVKRAAAGTALHEEEVVFSLRNGSQPLNLFTAEGMGLTEFSIIAHYANPDHGTACSPNVELWASKLPCPVYAIDEHTAIVVRHGQVSVVTEGQWKLFNT